MYGLCLEGLVPQQIFTGTNIFLSVIVGRRPPEISIEEVQRVTSIQVFESFFRVSFGKIYCMIRDYGEGNVGSFK